MSLRELSPFVLLERADHNDRLASFRVGPAGPEVRLPAFQAGQHVRVSVPGEDGSWSRRPLSIASAPEERHWLEFLVSRAGSTDDPFVERLWSLVGGDVVQVASAAEGRLTVSGRMRPDDHRFTILMAAGTGIAPFASMVRSWSMRGDLVRLARTAVLHGVTNPADLAYEEEFRAALEDVRYLPSVSGSPGRDRWTGATGRVETLVEPGRIEATERALGLPSGAVVPEKAAVFVCGFPGTVERVEAALRDRGYSRELGTLFTEG